MIRVQKAINRRKARGAPSQGINGRCVTREATLSMVMPPRQPRLPLLLHGPDIHLPLTCLSCLTQPATRNCWPRTVPHLVHVRGVRAQ
ncbi:hypothetical protein E2C01_061709 [Portunus trituberculatus]|uniref:Uncharacterized protein n=1 Tax=Portunus trituberculatus TaxID=210409 RepID=A0A5B7H8W5_PORTR|nr:hypothetical protein [Portunus trituberculatus]